MAILVKLETVLAARQATSDDAVQDLAREFTRDLSKDPAGTSGANPAAALPVADDAADLPFSTLEAICQRLDCQPGDILSYADKQQSLPSRLASRFRWVNRL